MRNQTLLLMIGGGVILAGIVYFVTRPSAASATPTSFFGGGGNVATGGNTDIQAGFAALGAGLNTIGGIATSVIDARNRENAAAGLEA